MICEHARERQASRGKVRDCASNTSQDSHSWKQPEGPEAPSEETKSDLSVKWNIIQAGKRNEVLHLLQDG